MSSKRIYLVRHCKAEGQQPEAGLTVEGFGQARELAVFFAGLEVGAIISSPYKRALQTAEPLSRERDIAVERDDRLRERVLSTTDHPDWMNKLKQTYADPDLKFEGGESSREAAARGVAVIREALARDQAHTVIVTHGALMSLIINHFTPGFGYDEWKSLTNPDVYRLTFSTESCKAERLWSL
ncbi:histidine phosphatase family protein [Paenibacillus contaminans]|uniref:Histidine phosphatase family protein n=1 Tax=Paenibacillus contaminans TaxID=450362 RepID=A0A329LW67_9BACL|nr:histidine phosphatase family protein [Paenibacillus contaminans]RAV12205.1 histidine phosphatase family protein [Paenibacillus contaminans]